jgi:hypothetical protein
MKTTPSKAARARKAELKDPNRNDLKNISDQVLGKRTKPRSADLPLVSLLRRELGDFVTWHCRDLDRLNDVSGDVEDQLDVLSSMEQRLKTMLSRLAAAKNDKVYDLIQRLNAMKKGNRK